MGGVYNGLTYYLFIMVYSAYYLSPLGKLQISGSDVAISGVAFEGDSGFVAESDAANGAGLPPLFDEAIAQLRAYFAHDLQVFDLPLQMLGTAFQCRVWGALCGVGYGETSTYGAIAQVLGDMKAVRAVGAANGRNPIAIVVPCHRIIGGNGALVGYAGGLWRKQWLLEHERKHNTLTLF